MGGPDKTFTNKQFSSENQKHLNTIEVSYKSIFTPLMTNGLSHPYHLDESTFIFRGTGSIFFSFFDENHVSKQNSQRWDAAFCSPMSRKKDVRLIWVIVTLSDLLDIAF